MLYDSTGRTDLLGEESTRELTTAQYHSVRRLAAELPADTEVYPTHGFGSFCAASATGRDSSTVGEQRETNPALTQDEKIRRRAAGQPVRRIPPTTNTWG